MIGLERQHPPIGDSISTRRGPLSRAAPAREKQKPTCRRVSQPASCKVWVNSDGIQIHSTCGSSACPARGKIRRQYQTVSSNWYSAGNRQSTKPLPGVAAPSSRGPARTPSPPNLVGGLINTADASCHPPGAQRCSGSPAGAGMDGAVDPFEQQCCCSAAAGAHSRCRRRLCSCTRARAPQRQRSRPRHIFFTAAAGHRV